MPRKPDCIGTWCVVQYTCMLRQQVSQSLGIKQTETLGRMARFERSARSGMQSLRGSFLHLHMLVIVPVLCSQRLGDTGTVINSALNTSKECRCGYRSQVFMPGWILVLFIFSESWRVLRACDSSNMMKSSASDVAKPCLFMHVAKGTNYLIRKGFNAGHMLLASCVTPGGATLSTTAIFNDGIVLGIVSSSFKGGRVKTDLSATSLNQTTAGTTYEDLVLGLNLLLLTTVPSANDQGKAQLVYQHNCAAPTAAMQGFKTKPSLELTANVGSERLSVGVSLAYDIKSHCFIDTTAGLGFTIPELSAALIFNPKNDKSINAYCSQEVNPHFSWGFHFNHWLAKKNHAATVGGSYRPNVLTTVEAQMYNHGLVGLLMQYEPKPLVTVGLSAEIDAIFLKTTEPKVGPSFSVLTV